VGDREPLDGSRAAGTSWTRVGACLIQSPTGGTLQRRHGRRVDELWLDHDLEGEDTIWPVAEVLERAPFDQRPFDIGVVYIHSANPLGPCAWMAVQGALMPRCEAGRCVSRPGGTVFTDQIHWASIARVRPSGIGDPRRPHFPRSKRRVRPRDLDRHVHVGDEAAPRRSVALPAIAEPGNLPHQ
jgi:hypothetical protein